MGAAVYVVLEKQIPGLDIVIDGKMLSQAEEHLVEVAMRLGVRPLVEFFSMAPEEARSFLEGEGLDDIEVPPEQWFPAEEGLRTIQALLGEVGASPELKEAKEDLLGLERVLKEAQKYGVRWHLGVDV